MTELAINEQFIETVANKVRELVKNYKPEIITDDNYANVPKNHQWINGYDFNILNEVGVFVEFSFCNKHSVEDVDVVTLNFTAAFRKFDEMKLSPDNSSNKIWLFQVDDDYMNNIIDDVATLQSVELFNKIVKEIINEKLMNKNKNVKGDPASINDDFLNNLAHIVKQQSSYVLNNNYIEQNGQGILEDDHFKNYFDLSYLGSENIWFNGSDLHIVNVKDNDANITFKDKNNEIVDFTLDLTYWNKNVLKLNDYFAENKKLNDSTKKEYNECVALLINAYAAQLVKEIVLSSANEVLRSLHHQIAREVYKDYGHFNSLEYRYKKARLSLLVDFIDEIVGVTYWENIASKRTCSEGNLFSYKE